MVGIGEQGLIDHGDETEKTVTCVVIAEHVKNEVSLKRNEARWHSQFRPL